MIRVLNLDDSLLAQKTFLKEYSPNIVDLKRYGPRARIWLDSKTARSIANELDPTVKHYPTFIGSGDYHHLSSLLIQQFDEPLTVVVFDHHPDWDIMPPRLACASWVTYVLRRPNIKKVILVGISSEDISTRIINTGNLKAFQDNRLEIYPYQHRPTKVFFRRVSPNRSIKVRGAFPFSVIEWRELCKEDVVGAFKEIISHIETHQVYVSIDKDCLKAQFAMTNWEEGMLNLDDVISMIVMLKERFDIVGTDIVGDYSKPIFDHFIKKAYMILDRHKDYTAKAKSSEEVIAINESTNLKLIKALFAVQRN